MSKLHFFAAAFCAALSAPAHPAPAPAAPAATAPDAEKLALAARVSAALWPDGTYGRIFQGMMGGENGLLDMALDMRPSDFLGAMAEGAGSSAAEGKAAPAAKPSPTLREAMRKEDPHFEERMRITAKVAGEEMTRLAAPIEPKLRDGLAKSIARRFTRAQLGPIAAFFATEPGKAYAAQSMALFLDKDVVLAMISSVPAVIKEVPGIMEKVAKATAHLPKPKAKAAEEAPNTGDSNDSDADSSEKEDEQPSA